MRMDTDSMCLNCSYLAYDIISELGFGAPVGFIEAGCDRQNIVPNLHHGLRIKALFNRLYPLVKLIQKTGIGRSYFQSSPGDSSGLGILMKLRDTYMAQRLDVLKEGKEGRADLLQTFLQARTADDKPLEIDYIKSEVLLILTAGADTTGTVMQGLIHHVLTRPDVKQKLMAEIGEAEKKGLISAAPLYEEVTHNLPYYVACVQEVLRLWPSSPALFPRVVGKQGIMFGDKLAPAGVEVTSSAWLIQRDKELYGADAEYFNPDRWMDPEQAKLYNKYLFAFGYGARVCLGKEIALMEIYKAPLQVTDSTTYA
jgi:cytochrome P450